jgi:hypothetical protein
MDKVMRGWVLACMLLFALRQFLPDYEPRFSVVEFFAILFALLLTTIAGVTVYRRIKEGQRERSAQSRS